MIRRMGLLFLLGLVAFVPVVGAQEMPKPAPRPVFNDESIAIWLSLFHYQKIEPIVQHNSDDYSDVIVVVYLRPRGGRAEGMIQQHVQKALRSGGAVLIVSDNLPTLGNYFPNSRDVTMEILDNGVSTSNEASQYFGDRNRFFGVIPPPNPLLDEMLKQFNANAGENEWFGNLQRVLFSSPSSIHDVRRPLELKKPVALFPPQAEVTRNGRRARALAKNEYLAMAGDGPARNAYRCGILADSSVFTNEAVLTSGAAEPNQTDNFQFAFQTVKWLQGPQKRSKCLFFDSGVPQETFDYVDWATIQQPQIPPIPPILPKIDFLNREFQAKLAETGDKALAELENRNIVNRAITGDENDDRRYYRLLAILLVVACVFAIFWGWRRSRAARLQRDYQPMPNDPLRLGEGVAHGSFEHRRLEQVRAQDLLPPVREYLQLLFEERGQTLPVETRIKPKFLIASRNKRALNTALQTLWAIAYTDTLKKLPYSRWKELEPMIAMVRTAADADSWHVQPNGGTA